MNYERLGGPEMEREMFNGTVKEQLMNGDHQNVGKENNETLEVRSSGDSIQAFYTIEGFEVADTAVIIP